MATKLKPIRSDAAVRARLAVIADTLRIPDVDADKVLRNTRTILAFADQHGLSLDWWLRGDPRGMIVAHAREFRAKRGRAA